MNVFIKFYQGQFGNASTDILTLDKGNNITVRELKKVIQEKYNIQPQNQRLTYNIVEDYMVLLTNDWKLSFFHIHEHSMIYLEHIQVVNKQEEIFNKVLNSTKSKYLKSLGFLSHFGSNLPTIRESRNEPKYESVVHSNLNGSMSNDEEEELLIAAVKQNNIHEVKELLESYKESISLNYKAKNGWAAIHFASYYGYTEVLIELIMKNADPNIRNKDNWTPLHLACYKGKDEVVKVLLNVPDIDVDVNLETTGTPLHLACKRNCVKIVSLLLFKAKIE